MDTKSEENLFFAISLLQSKGLGSVLFKRLVEFFGSPKQVFEESKGALSKIHMLGRSSVNSITKKEGFSIAERELKFIQQNNVRIHYYLDADFPRRLKPCFDSPALLFGYGNYNLNKAKQLALVGTRNCTSYGKQCTKDIVNGLKEHSELSIISGLAHGIDGIAHQAAIDASIETVGVMAHGLNQIYPANHRDLVKQMQQNGGVITEYISSAPAMKENFPMRNRIVAGLSDATIVIESKKRGGAMITADIAFNYNRDVMALPGRSGDVVSEGCNYLIKSNKALLIENSRDIEHALSWNLSKPKQNKQQRLLIDLTAEQEEICKLLESKGKLSADEICALTQKPTSEIASTLFIMELESIVRTLPGKLYSLA